MRRLTLLAVLIALVASPPAALAFHHTTIPASECANAAAGSPSNDNGQAKEAIREHNPVQGGSLPLPPAGTPGDGQGAGGEHCANA